MPTYEFPAPEVIDVSQLRDEVIAAVGTPSVVSRTPDTITLTFPDDIDWTLLEGVIGSHQPDEIAQLAQLVEKARAVWVGTDTFTAAQAQKIMAGLVLLENRRR